MTNSKKDGLDALLRTYSITSEREDDWLSRAILRNTETDNTPLDTGSVKAFMERFSDVRPFADLVNQAIHQKGMTQDDVSRELGIPKEVMDKVLIHSALPSVIPLRKMLALLRSFSIPLANAIDAMRVSLNRLKTVGTSGWIAGQAMRRGTHISLRSTGRAEEVSREALRRDLEVYIKRLKEEGV